MIVASIFKRKGGDDEFVHLTPVREAGADRSAPIISGVTRNGDRFSMTSEFLIVENRGEQTRSVSLDDICSVEPGEFGRQTGKWTLLSISLGDASVLELRMEAGRGSSGVFNVLLWIARRNRSKAQAHGK